MKKYNEKQREILSIMFDIEDMINIEKSWIEISNAIMDNPVDYGMHIGLVLSEIEKQNAKIYTDYENLMTCIQKML